MAQYGSVQMGLHGSPCGFWITFDDGLQNDLMLFDREWHGMRKKQNLRDSALQLSADERDEVEDQIIVGCPGDTEVKLEVERGEALRITYGHFHLRYQISQLLDVCIRAIACGASRSDPLERNTHFHEVFNVMLLGAQAPPQHRLHKLTAIYRNGWAFAHTCGQNTHDGKATHRLAQRRTTSPKSYAQVAF